MKHVDKEINGRAWSHFSSYCVHIVRKFIIMDPSKMDSQKVGVQFTAVREVMSPQPGRNWPHV